MSSHHFVKEGQEPALIFANGARCKSTIVNQLLEWSPFVLVLDGALQSVLELGIAINAVSGDFDSEPQVYQKLKDFPQVEIFETPNQDFTDLHKGIDICITKGYKNINVVWGTGERTDHTLGNLDLIARLKEQVQITFWDDYHQIYHLHNGFKKWFKKGQDISIIPWPKAKKVNAANLKWPLVNMDLRMNYQLSTCNVVAEDGILSVDYEDGDLIMFEGHFN